MTNETAERLLTEQSAFWAHVEVIGRREHWGRVTIESIGGAAFFRVDVPDKPEVTERRRCYGRVEGDQEGVSQYGLYEVTEGPVAGQTYLIGTGSIYQITPVPEETARKQAASKVAGPVLKMVRIEEVKAISSSAFIDDDPDNPDDDDPDNDDQEEDFPF